MLGKSYIEFIGIKGRQGNKPLYISSWPISMVISLLANEIESLELNAEKKLDYKFIKKLQNDLHCSNFNIGSSPIIIGICGQIDFEELKDFTYYGKIKFETDSKLTIIDGCHRLIALHKSKLPKVRLDQEEIPIMIIPLSTTEKIEMASLFFQQFHQEKIQMQPSRELSPEILRELAKDLLRHSRFLGRTVETEVNTLSVRSRKLFTLSVLSKASAPMFNVLRNSNVEKYDILIADYWQFLGNLILPWKLYLANRRTGEEIRKSTVLTSSAVLVAFGRIGAIVLEKYPTNWRDIVSRLGSMDWEKSSPIWLECIVENDKIIKGKNAEILVFDVMKKTCGIDFLEDENKVKIER